MRSLLLSAIVTGCIVVPASQASAQGVSPGANASRFGTAVVDINYIFKNYSRFTTSLEGLKTQMKTIDDQLKRERADIAAKEEERGQYKVGSADYKRVDEEIARKTADFQLKTNRIRKEFLEKEAKVYYETYQEVSKAVKYYAQQHNIGLVLRFNGDPIDPNVREQILKAIMVKTVVYQNNIDITPDVLALLNRGGSPGGQTPTARQPGGTATR